MNGFRKILLVFISFLLGCATSRQVTDVESAVSVKSKAEWAIIEIPAEVSMENAESHEAVLFSLPIDHPERKELRDKLVNFRVTLFNELSQDDEDGRLEQFQQALLLHEPVDFRLEEVSKELEPAALWVMSHFEARGKEAQVLAAYLYMHMVKPQDDVYWEKYLSLVEWSLSVRETVADPIERFSSIVQLFNSVIDLVPHKDVINRLSFALQDRQQAIISFIQAFSQGNARLSPLFFKPLIDRSEIGRELVRAYFMGDYLNLLVSDLEKDGLSKSIDEDIINTLIQLNQGRQLALNYHRLARLLGNYSPAAGLKACLRAYKIKPKEHQFALCAGRFFSDLDRHISAMEYYSKAATKESSPEVLIQVMDLMREALYRIHMQDMSPGISYALKLAISTVENVRNIDKPNDQLWLTASSLAEMVASIEFDDGKIDDSQKNYLLAMQLWPSRPSTLIKLAEIKMGRENWKEAIAVLDESLSSSVLSKGSFVDYWKAIMYELRGDSRRFSGDEKEAQKDYQLALDTWKKADYPLEQAPAIAIRRGILLHYLGKIEESTAQFRESIRLGSERRASYAEILSFLVMEDRLNDAVVFYKIAFNQDRLDTMWKIYFSMWIEGLFLRKTGESFELARGYLENIEGTSWQEYLAQYFTGKITSAQLRQKAVNKGQFVEADYYEALIFLSDDKNEEAKSLLKKVIGSELMAFFEFKMAKALLRII